MMHHFEQAFCTEFYAAPIIDGAMHKVPDVVLMKLLERLSLLKLPAQIQRVLEVMQLDERPMPQRKDLLVSESGVEARTFITMWFDGRSYYYEPTGRLSAFEHWLANQASLAVFAKCMMALPPMALVLISVA